MKPLWVPISQLQPSQLYINIRKLEDMLEKMADISFYKHMDPLPVVEIDGQMVLTDGHTRALSALLNGHTEVPVMEDTDELDMSAYATFVGWCRDEGVCCIADLQERVILAEDFQILWISRCEVVYKEKKYSVG